MILVCYALLGWSLGMATALFLYAWLDERSDRYAGIPWSADLGLDSQYKARVALTATVIQTVCAYCRVLTTSRYCRPCGVYYCEAHNATAHRLCGPQALPPVTTRHREGVAHGR